MTVAAGVGYALIALGPALSLFSGVVARKPFLVLTLLSSDMRLPLWNLEQEQMFLLLNEKPRKISHIVLVNKFDNPLGSVEGISSYKIWSMVVIHDSDPFISCIARRCPSCVLEALQVGKLCQKLKISGKMEEMLDAFADKISKPRLSWTDKMLIYLAIIALGFLVIHTFSMIIAFNGYDEKKKSDQIVVPVVHLAAAVMTLVNLAPGGCLIGMPLLLVTAALTLQYCWRVVCRRLTEHQHGQLS
ncbi:hypothetical protein PR202_ga07155 [Eleusine coracana subsp. coracana]|uniref:Uncharacterized protein n=1 Tax=Eleusine coracana subsp. coracana TaxID=191504 RepID=A0AAV5BZC7_ELECO|nr:hypothetical protein PR202_ga07155 [Eleusine coracana subsp. coracana]